MLSLSVALLVACATVPERTPHSPTNRTSERSLKAEENFSFHWQGMTADAQLAVECERLLSELRNEWFAAEEIAWRPRCHVVIHGQRETYLQAVGAAGRPTVGSARVRIVRGKIVERRIDLLAVDLDEALHHLRHELVHVLFAERFPDRPSPRWAEEGLALLMDSAEKQARHRRDLQYAVENEQTLPLPELLTAQQYPTGWQRSVFYGQSLALVEYLVALDSPRSFLRFVDLASRHGHDHALRSVYQVPNVAALRRQWRLDVPAGATQAD